MTRQEYMEELANAISHCPRNQQDEILADFDEHFDIATSKGLSDDEIIESLGDIKDFIKELKVEENWNAKPIFEMDDEITEVEIICEGCDVKIVEGERTEMNIKSWRATMNSKYNISEKVIDNKYIIKVELIKNRFFFLNTDLIVEVSINNTIKKVRVENKIGDVSYDASLMFVKEVEMILGNGDVSVVGSIENLTINNNKGDVEIDTIAGEYVNIHANLGDVSVLASANEVFINANSGDVDFDVKSRILDVHSNKGDIEGTVSSNSIQCISNMGDIKCTIIDAEEVVCKTNMGDIEADIASLSDYILETKTSMGDIDTEEINAIDCGDCFIKGDQNTSIYLKTNMGDIKVKD